MRRGPVYPLIKNIPIKELKSRGWNFVVVSIASLHEIIVLRRFFDARQSADSNNRSAFRSQNPDAIDRSFRNDFD